MDSVNSNLSNELQYSEEHHTKKRSMDNNYNTLRFPQQKTQRTPQVMQFSKKFFSDTKESQYDKLYEGQDNPDLHHKKRMFNRTINPQPIINEEGIIHEAMPHNAHSDSSVSKQQNERVHVRSSLSHISPNSEQIPESHRREEETLQLQQFIPDVTSGTDKMNDKQNIQSLKESFSNSRTIKETTPVPEESVTLISQKTAIGDKSDSGDIFNQLEHDFASKLKLDETTSAKHPADILRPKKLSYTQIGTTCETIDKYKEASIRYRQHVDTNPHSNANLSEGNYCTTNYQECNELDSAKKHLKRRSSEINKYRYISDKYSAENSTGKLSKSCDGTKDVNSNKPDDINLAKGQYDLQDALSYNSEYEWDTRDLPRDETTPTWTRWYARQSHSPMIPVKCHSNGNDLTQTQVRVQQPISKRKVNKMGSRKQHDHTKQNDIFTTEKKHPVIRIPVEQKDQKEFQHQTKELLSKQGKHTDFQNEKFPGSSPSKKLFRSVSLPEQLCSSTIDIATTQGRKTISTKSDATNNILTNILGRSQMYQPRKDEEKDLQENINYNTKPKDDEFQKKEYPIETFHEFHERMVSDITRRSDLGIYCHERTRKSKFIKIGANRYAIPATRYGTRSGILERYIDEKTKRPMYFLLQFKDNMLQPISVVTFNKQIHKLEVVKDYPIENVPVAEWRYMFV